MPVKASWRTVFRCGDLCLDPPVDPVELPADGADGQPDRWECDQGQERETPLLDEHDGQERDDGGNLAERPDQDRGGGPSELA